MQDGRRTVKYRSNTCNYINIIRGKRGSRSTTVSTQIAQPTVDTRLNTNGPHGSSGIGKLIEEYVQTRGMIIIRTLHTRYGIKFRIFRSYAKCFRIPSCQRFCMDGNLVLYAGRIDYTVDFVDLVSLRTGRTGQLYRQEYMQFRNGTQRLIRIVFEHGEGLSNLSGVSLSVEQIFTTVEGDRANSVMSRMFQDRKSLATCGTHYRGVLLRYNNKNNNMNHNDYDDNNNNLVSNNRCRKLEKMLKRGSLTSSQPTLRQESLSCSEFRKNKFVATPGKY